MGFKAPLPENYGKIHARLVQMACEASQSCVYTPHPPISPGFPYPRIIMATPKRPFEVELLSQIVTSYHASCDREVIPSKRTIVPLVIASPVLAIHYYTNRAYSRTRISVSRIPEIVRQSLDVTKEPPDAMKEVSQLAKSQVEQAVAEVYQRLEEIGYDPSTHQIYTRIPSVDHRLLIYHQGGEKTRVSFRRGVGTIILAESLPNVTHQVSSSPFEREKKPYHKLGVGNLVAIEQRFDR